MRCLEPACARRIEEFLDAIAELSPAQWLALAAASDWESLPAVAARWRLQMLLAEPELVVDAWYVRDLATTCSWRCRHPGAQTTAHDRRRLRVACEGVTWAALALLARARLSSSEVDALHAPFAAIMAHRSV